MIRLVSFNIRTPAKVDGPNYLPHRVDNIIATIKEKQPDLIGFQELIADENYQRIKEGLPEYDDFGYGRYADLTNETNKIFFKKDAFQLLYADQMWLSDTPRKPGSRFEIQSNCPRVLVALKLFHKETGKRFYVINTHLDHISNEARVYGLKQLFHIAAKLKAEEDLPIFITGDFNFDCHEPLYEQFALNGYTDLTADLGYTFHGFMKSESFSKIDYILCDTTLDFEASKWHEGAIPGVFISDHDPVCVDFDLR